MFSSFSLKCLAISTMAVDHVGALLTPDGKSLIWRCIGRLSFPIFCFLIVEGYFHTRNLYRYILRLLLFALVSEIPYDLAFRNSLFELKKQNVFFTLCIGLVLIALLDNAPAWISRLNKRRGQSAHDLFFDALTLGVCMVLVMVAYVVVARIRSDYTVWGIFMILAFYLFRDRPVLGMPSFMLVNARYGAGIQSLAAFSVIPLMLYNGEKGRSMRWFFYAFYPAHLMVLYFIEVLLH